MVKPDGVQRGLVGEIIGRFEKKGFKLKGLKLYQTPKEVRLRALGGCGGGRALVVASQP